MKNKTVVNIKIIKNETTELLEQIDNFQINIINKNNKNEKTIEFYKLMMENLILEHHNLCKKFFN